jgi:hypothetical protein
VNHDEMVDLLSLISARDNRTVGHTTVMAWLEDIGDLAFIDCKEAVTRHFRDSTDWLMPATVRRLVKTVRAGRLEGFQYVPVEGDDDHRVYLAALRAQRQAVADGRREAAPALEGGTTRDVPALLAQWNPRP